MYIEYIGSCIEQSLSKRADRVYPMCHYIKRRDNLPAVHPKKRSPEKDTEKFQFVNMSPRGEQPLKLPLRKCKNFVDNLKQIFYSINAIIKSAKLCAGNSSAIRDD